MFGLLACPVYTRHSSLQVLSNSVASALRITRGEEAKETANFEMMDKFLDCLNVGDFDSEKLSRNLFKSPYRSGTDFRLSVIFSNHCKNSCCVCTCAHLCRYMYST